MQENNLNETEIVVLLDRSGSMGSIAKATVEGFNTFLNEQKNAEGEAYLTLVQFDDRYEVNYKSVPIKDVPELINGETYIPRATTALFDSIGKTINELQTDRDVVFVIITDGHENASKEFKQEAIKNMIETLESENKWKFLFLAANQDAVTTGGAIGIKMQNSMSWATTDSGIGSTYYSMSANIGSYRSAKSKYVSKNLEKSIDYTEYMEQNLSTLSFSDAQRRESMDENKTKTDKSGK